MNNKIKCYDKVLKKIVYIDKENSHLIDGENIIKSLKYQRCVRYKDDPENKCFTIFLDDPRLETGELIANTSKHMYECNVHGKQPIEDYKMMSRVQIPEKYKVYCQKCKELYLSKEYMPSEEDLINCREALKEIYFSCSNQQTEKYFKKYMPHFFRILNDFNIDDLKLSFARKIHLFKNKITEAPMCRVHSCKNKASLGKNTAQMDFNDYCENHKFYNFSSKAENEIFEFISENYNGEIHKNYRKINNIELDIFLPSLNIAIEYNGLYWHSDRFKAKKEHSSKIDFFESKGISVLTIWEDDWIHKSELIKSIILFKLKMTKEKIYARNCVVKNIPQNMKNVFLKNNHLQGNCPSSINYGLFHNEELVSVITFGKNRKILGKRSIDGDYELLRFCSKKNTSIIGAASKLFKHFVLEYEPTHIISYANRDISNGALYEKIGFNLVGKTAINYWWSFNCVKYHRSNFMKHKLVKQGFNPSMSEDQIMKERGYFKIWGTGNLKYEWKKQRV